MSSIERSVTINAPPSRVYDAFVDLSRWREWNPHFREVRLLDEGLLSTGSRARIALKLSPLATLWEVTQLNPGRSFAWTSSSLPGLRLLFDHVAEPAEGGTRATLRINVEGPLSFMAPLGSAFYARNLGHSLDALKRMLEGEASSSPEPEPAAEAEAEAEAEPEAEGEPEAEAEPKNE